VGGGEGFRRFRLGENGAPLKVEQVDDMVELQPFEAATNRTSVFSCEKGKQTTYPIPYILWQKAHSGAIDSKLSFDEVFTITRRANLSAQPIGEVVTSPWISARLQALRTIRKISGPSTYQARAGTCTWLNGVYWGRYNNHMFANANTIGRTTGIEPVEREVEETLVFSLLRGRDISRWNAVPNYHIIIGQNLSDPANAYSESELEELAPLTLGYFRNFEELLRRRSGYRKYFKNAPFYAIYNIGPYTFATYKVVWPWISSDLISCVVSVDENDKPVLPEHNTSFVPFDNPEEAHYFCAVLNSSPARFVAIASCAGGGGGIASPTILERISIPAFEKNNPIHKELARISEDCHKKTLAGVLVNENEEQIGNLTAELWELTDAEMQGIQESLEILNPSRRRESRNAHDINEEDDA